MRPRTALFVAFALTVWMVLGLTACDRPISGGACNQIGSTKKDSTGQVWTCAKNLKTGNGYRYKGTP